MALIAAPSLHERAATAMDWTPIVRRLFGVLVAICLYLTYVGRRGDKALPSA